MDLTSEEIAHFIGLFALTDDSMRERISYDPFHLNGRRAEPDAELPLEGVEIADSFELTPFRPNIVYNPPSFQIVPAAAGPIPIPMSPDVPMPDVWLTQNTSVFPFYGTPYFEFDFPLFQQLRIVLEFTVKPAFLEIEPPGQIAVVIHQYNSISDIDIIEFKDGMFDGMDFGRGSERIDELLTTAGRLDPNDLELLPPGSEAAIADMVAEIVELAAGIDAEPSGADADYAFVIRGESAVGAFVDGKLVDLPPVLSEFQPRRHDAEPEEGSLEQSHFDPETGEHQQQAGFEVVAGGNRLINETGILDAMLTSPLMYVLGNYTSIDLIVQTNIVSDHDAIEAGFTNHSPVSEAYNVAVRLIEANDPFEGIDQSSLSLPANFRITTLGGNYVNIDWIKQTNYVIDDDWIGVTRSGTSTFITTGENLAVNASYLTEIGMSFDLIVVLGDVWKANVIFQSNIFADDDTVWRDSPLGNSSYDLESGNNLAWNEASITHVGGTSFAPLSPEAKNFAEAVKGGPTYITYEMLQNENFAGFGTLDVLVIEGDYLDLTYVEQRNILSDSDNLLIDEGDGPLGPNEISLAQNEAINIASIIKYGVDQHVEVGGTVYSEAAIYQAGFLDVDDPDDAPVLDDLASEAVVFLADEMLKNDDTCANDELERQVQDQDADDLMQTMLA
ncbi:hypothetical protein FP2506_01230 [Fulvimarina pelagi HTCC2506]|uniref:Uncharacterized protein n=2 Tax=Fulvimarina pelagi TaxID=217511 RepID=Q0G251_9HYPH|nr:hypothetical protein [Fulvimarina pelagi]EAU41347.1 hypothetical protein FP2506_01230 [Fulvimarina pelagi HTCC2506]